MTLPCIFAPRPGQCSGRSFTASLAQPTWKLKMQRNIRENNCYHEGLRTTDAQETLNQQRGSSYLIRYSMTHEDYVLSVLKRGHNECPIYEHFIIKSERTPLEDIFTYTVEGSDKSFHEVSAMLDYYTKNPINDTVGCIGKPCPKRPRPKPRSFRKNVDKPPTVTGKTVEETNLGTQQQEFREPHNNSNSNSNRQQGPIDRSTEQLSLEETKPQRKISRRCIIL